MVFVKPKPEKARRFLSSDCLLITDHDWYCPSMWTSEHEPRNMIFATRWQWSLITIFQCVPLLV